jgi:hypothetical protein
MRSLVVVLAALGCLGGLAGTRAAQTCTQKFAGLQTCTLFNGQFASGDAASLAATTLIDSQLLAGYKNYTQGQKDSQCRTLYLLYGCINAIVGVWHFFRSRVKKPVFLKQNQQFCVQRTCSLQNGISNPTHRENTERADTTRSHHLPADGRVSSDAD